MKEGKDDWEILKEIRDIKPEMALGADSSVFPLVDKDKTNSVAKLYNGSGFSSIGHENSEEVLKQYYVDTERAVEILETDPNPLKQSVKINGEIFSLHYEVVPQGPLMLDKNNGKLKALVGQKFIGGLNLSFLREIEFIGNARSRGEEPAETQQIFVNNRELCKKIDKDVEKFFSYLSQILNVSFDYTATNVKPFINNKEKKIVIIITDLCGSLRSYYEESPKFRELRSRKVAPPN